MNKVCITALAIITAVAFIPSAPAQVPAAAGNTIAQAVCAAGADATVFPAVTAGLSGSHTGVASYNQNTNTNVHRYDFCGSEGDAAYFFVDNVDTGSDVWACLIATPASPCNPTFYNSILNDLGGDDELPCTVPHLYACPAGDAPLPADSNGDGVYHLVVGTWSAPGGYAGYVQLNGADVPVFRL